MFRNVKLLSWLVAILLVTNLATIITVIYHTRTESKVITNKGDEHVPGDRRTRYFKEQLHLTDEQLVPFREANRRFNRRTRALTDHLSDQRSAMLRELFSDAADQKVLAAIAAGVGADHEQLKLATCEFYLELKSLCTEEQKEQLAAIFQSLLDAEEKVQLPGKKHRNGKGRLAE
ncbi:Spy/CpxP family protein refolding chaperone [Mangrovibacterium marinum]|nr:periplasmic heavy metal sensor [Mangrovibacterium marinum]